MDGPWELDFGQGNVRDFFLSQWVATLIVVCFIYSQPSAASQASRKKLESVFGGGDDDDLGGAAPKRKLVKLDDEDIAKDESDEAEDKKRIIKSLIERIPTAKDELFAYSLDWSIVDQVSVEWSMFVQLSFV